MKIVLYGMPCAGKSTLMEGLTDIEVIHGSKELARICGGRFSELTETEKKQMRLKYIEYLRDLEAEDILSDGHYSFLDEVVFTEADAEFYDVFMYLYCSPETLKQRYHASEKNTAFACESEETIRKWQESEICALREECHRRRKDFYVISDNEHQPGMFYEFVDAVRHGYSAFGLACQISRHIMEQAADAGDHKKEICIVDGDRTMIREDSYRYCCDADTQIFDGDFYTGYQSYLFEKEIRDIRFSQEKLAQLHLNQEIYDEVADQNYIVLSSGVEYLWKQIAAEKHLQQVYAHPLICADTKYYVVKLLHEQGYAVHAYGDSKIDLYMLREADWGTVVIGKRLSRSLRNESLAGLELRCDRGLTVLTAETESSAGDTALELEADIAVCRSNSGIHGCRLAAAHTRLGELMGKRLAEVYPERDTAVLVLERGGRFFGDGLYMGFGGTLYPINPKKDELPEIHAQHVIIADSVINSGRSVQRIIEYYKKHAPEMDIIIAANVLQENAIQLFLDYPVYTVRVSKNSYVGRNQVRQTNETGPDTADRLFNLIGK